MTLSLPLSIRQIALLSPQCASLIILMVQLSIQTMTRRQRKVTADQERTRLLAREAPGLETGPLMTVHGPWSRMMMGSEIIVIAARLVWSIKEGTALTSSFTAYMLLLAMIIGIWPISQISRCVSTHFDVLLVLVLVKAAASSVGPRVFHFPTGPLHRLFPPPPSSLWIIGTWLWVFLVRVNLPHSPADLSGASQADTASWASLLLTYSWTSGPIWSGQSRALTLKDMLTLPMEIRGSSLALAGKSQRRSSYGAVDSNEGAVHLAPLFARGSFAVGLRIAWFEHLMCFITMMIYALSMVASPLALNQLLRYLQTKGTNMHHPTVEPIFWAVLLLVLPMISSIAFNRGGYYQIIGRIKTAGPLMLEVYAKIVYTQTVGVSRDSNQSRNFALTNGRATSLFATDCEKSADVLWIYSALVYPILAISLSSLFLFRIVGYSGFVGLAVLLLTFPFSGELSRRVSQKQRQALGYSDARLSITSEFLHGIRPFRALGWTAGMVNRIKEARAKEQIVIWKRYLLTAVLGVVTEAGPLFTLAVTFGDYSWMRGKKLDTSTAFAAVAIFDVIRAALSRAADRLTDISMAFASCGRIDEYLQSPDETGSKTKVTPHDQGQLSRTDFCLHDFSCQIGTFNLQNITLDFIPGRVNLIVGPVASGKSCLLLAILGHWTPTTGFVKKPGRIAYAAQTPWIQSKSFKDNVLFGEQWSAVRYQQVLHACALDVDIRSLPLEDLTILSDQGSSLSGGQKARLGLARALYSRADTLLLDDIFSALDQVTAHEVASRVFVSKMLQGRTTVLATHHSELIHAARTIRLDKGRVISVDDHKDLERSPKDRQLLQETLDLQSTAQADPGLRQEVMASGRLPGAMMLRYLLDFGRGSGKLYLLLLISIAIISQLVLVLATLWLSQWTTDEHSGDATRVRFWNIGYIGTICLYLIFNLLTSLLFLSGAWRAARKRHNEMVSAVFGSQLAFFDATPLGVVVNRFSKDTGSLDSNLVSRMRTLIDSSLRLGLRTLSMTVILPVVLIPIAVAFSVVTYLGRVYTTAQISIKRLVSTSLSPVLAHLSETMDGIVTIQAFAREADFQAEMQRRIDEYFRCTYTLFNTNRWIMVRGDMTAAFVSFSTACIALYIHNVDAGLVAFSLTNAIGLSSTILGLIRASNDLEVEMNAYQRILEFCQLPQEGSVQPSPNIPVEWPTTGSLEIRGVGVTYASGEHRALHDITFTARSGDRIGIVGRSGSGKSTLAAAILRLVDFSGEIIIDGVSTQDVPLGILRQRIGVVTQDSMLFKGTIRENLLPANLEASDHSRTDDPSDDLIDDQKLYEELESCGFRSESTATAGDPGHEASSLHLDSLLHVGGSNLSHGQRQTVSLARAKLRKVRMVILDEATARLDSELNATIRGSLSKSIKANKMTLLDITHRPKDVLDYDEVLVLESGRIIERGKPGVLAQQSGSRFAALLDDRHAPQSTATNPG